MLKYKSPSSVQEVVINDARSNAINLSQTSLLQLFPFPLVHSRFPRQQALVVVNAMTILIRIHIIGVAQLARWYAANAALRVFNVGWLGIGRRANPSRTPAAR